MTQKLSVLNVAENQRALKKAGELDTKRAGTEAAKALLPFVKDATRSETGALRSGWIADEGFVNEVSYAGYQEYGTMFVEPMNAIGSALEAHDDLLTEAFEKEQERAADKAGFGS